MDRAISINVNPRKRCTAEVTRLTQNHNLPAICAHFTHTAGARACTAVKAIVCIFGAAPPNRAQRRGYRACGFMKRLLTKMTNQLFFASKQSLKKSNPSSAGALSL